MKRKARDNDFYLMYWVWKREFENINSEQQISLDFDRTNIVNIFDYNFNLKFTNLIIIIKYKLYKI